MFLDNNAQHIFPGKAENKDGAILGLFWPLNVYCVETTYRKTAKTFDFSVPKTDKIAQFCQNSSYFQIQMAGLVTAKKIGLKLSRIFRLQSWPLNTLLNQL